MIRFIFLLCFCLYNLNISCQTKVSLNIGPSIYSNFDAISGRNLKIFAVPSPIQFNLNLELDKLSSGDISLHFYKATRAKGWVNVKTIDGTNENIAFNSNKQLQNILDLNPELNGGNKISGLKLTQTNVRVAYQSHLLYNQDKKINIMPFVGYQYFKTHSIPYLSTSYPIINNIHGLNIGTTLQCRLNMSNRISFLIQLPLNLLLVGIEKSEVLNPNIPPRLQTQHKFHISSINIRNVPILFGLEYSFENKKSKKRRRRK